MAYEEIQIRRDCPAVQIPQGNSVLIPAGASAVVTQSLGGSYTVQVASLGGLFRVAGRDADALGLQPTAADGEAAGQAGPVSEDRVWEVLKHVYDPEIPVNIVDLGLVYDCVVEQPEGRPANVSVKMTLTAPGCGMGPIIASEARQKILSIDGVRDANVDLVWDPPWTPDRISEEGKQKLGMV
jgi:probable FeS assembly SUF system protein SufT